MLVVNNYYHLKKPTNLIISRQSSTFKRSYCKVSPLFSTITISTHLCTNSCFFFPKRFMFTRATQSSKLLQDRLLLNKTIFLKFCNHFKEIPLANLLKDKVFIEWVHKSMHDSPTLQSRAFQLALEVTYHKRQFSQKVLEDFYKNDFKIMDTFNNNDGLCDQSTIYTSVLTKYVVSYLNLSPQDVIVNSTPLGLNNISQESQAVMELSKKLTGNRCSDISLKCHPYDFKDTKDFKWNKNLIYFLDLDAFKTQGCILVRNLEQSLQNQIATSSSILSEEAKKYATSIQNLLKNKDISPQENFERIYKYMLSYQPPKDFRLPLLIPIKKANSNEILEKSSFSSQDIEKVDLKEGHLDDVKAKKAIQSILEQWSPEMKQSVEKAVQNAIRNSLSHVVPDTTDIS